MHSSAFDESLLRICLNASAVESPPPSADPSVLIRILAGCTTGAMAVSFAQPTDVVKVRFQAQMNLSGVARRYSGTMQAYKQIYQLEGFRGLWKGASPFIPCCSTAEHQVHVNSF